MFGIYHAQTLDNKLLSVAFIDFMRRNHKKVWYHHSTTQQNDNLHISCYEPYWINRADAETGIFRTKSVNTMAVDALDPRVAMA